MSLPKHLQALLSLYFFSSLAHFVHNAEYIAFYPNMPVGLTREGVYLAWLVVTAVGLLGLAALRLRLQIVGTVLIAAYGALGLDGLVHYTLGSVSEHSLLANVTIWSEALSGFALMLASAVWLVRGLVAKPATRAAA